MEQQFRHCLTITLFAMFAFAACGKEPPSTPATKVDSIVVSVGGFNFTAQLADTRAAQELAALLPLTMNLRELNGNEKYGDLPRALTTDSRRPGTILAGDIMLYGDDCLVIFYETFQSSYSYTPIGHISDPTHLKEALGTGSVEGLEIKINN